MFTVLYRDEHLIAIRKPSGVFVHPTSLSAERANCMHLLRDQIGQWVYPVHRLDRATSGVLLFALNPEAARLTSTLFQEKKIRKTYYAVVRGVLPDEGTVTKELREAPGKPWVEAVTQYRRVASVELPHAVGKHATTRYSLAEIEPQTGRLHQIRKHMSHLRHPIVGDTCYGDGRHNRFFRDQYGIQRLMLEARRVEFLHPYAMRQMRVEAMWSAEFLKLFGSWNMSIN